MIVATQNSLNSEPCREEVAYALNQALSARGPGFPIIALFPGPVEASLLPQALSTRLCVTCTDSNWKERIAAAANGRAVRIHEEVVRPYAVNVHNLAATRFVSGLVSVRDRSSSARRDLGALCSGDSIE